MSLPYGSTWTPKWIRTQYHLYILNPLDQLDRQRNCDKWVQVIIYIKNKFVINIIYLYIQYNFSTKRIQLNPLDPSWVRPCYGICRPCTMDREIEIIFHVSIFSSLLFSVIILLSSQFLNYSLFLLYSNVGASWFVQIKW